MICIKANIPKELDYIDDKLKAIYRSKDTVCFYLFENREMPNKFLDKTKGVNRIDREILYQKYKS